MPEVAAGRHLAELTAARADVDASWGLDGSDAAVLDRVLTVPWGTMPGRFVGFGYVQELTVHAWDLAAATGRTGGLDDGLAAAIEDTSRQVLPAEPRGGPIPFGPPVAVAERRRADRPVDRVAGSRAGVRDERDDRRAVADGRERGRTPDGPHPFRARTIWGGCGGRGQGDRRRNRTRPRTG